MGWLGCWGVVVVGIVRVAWVGVRTNVGGMSPYIRAVRTASGARAVQIVYSSRKGARSIEHIGSAHDDAELAALNEVARQRLSAGQLSLDLPGLDGADVGGKGPQALTGAGRVAAITSNRMGVLLETL